MLIVVGIILFLSLHTSSQKNTNKTSNKNVLNIYNWSDYVDESTVKEFEQKNHIKVNYDVYDSNETLQAKVLIGNSGYDLVAPSNIFVARQIVAQAYQPIDKSKISNYKNLSPLLLKLMQTADPGNQYAVPYFWGINTLAINKDQVQKALNGAPLPENEWDLLFKPEYAQKLQSCGISILDSPAEVYPVVLHYLHKEPKTNNLDDIKAAVEVLKGIRPYIKRFSSSGYIDDLARGDLCLVFGYGGDLNIAKRRAKEAKNGVDIAVLVPKGGVAIWVDSFMIPAGARNVDNALKYIDYTLEPSVAAKNGNFVTYAPASTPAKDLMEPEYASDPSIFLSDQMLEASFLNVPLDLKLNRLAIKYWNAMKKEN
ncbi:polyamine ABC transporter substrate-binding protein [Neisseria sp. Ec49-e6-T10]|uniref:polyamine ABC transporter substrate-binding protein n=1 Tax=Neisseria sp. Ec49-e6-T10 TaxID=3140744 RepID=UPI003EBE9620